MSGPIIKDNLLVILNQSNNWTSTGNLQIPVVNCTQVRILSNNSAIIQTNFTADAYILSTTNSSAIKVSGLCFAGDDKVWYDVKERNIQTPYISLYSPVNFTDLELNFQFI